MTKIYNFDAQTCEFTCADDARRDPIDGTPMVPANATLIAPPKTKANQVTIWRGDGWIVEVDNRGREYWLTDGSHHIINAIGDQPPDEALDVRPPRPREEQRNDAFTLIDQEHAHWLELLTGGATVAERDTWKVKEEAARAFLAGKATAGQKAMLTAEAKGATTTEANLAKKIVAKADAFLTLIGIAAGIRAKSRVKIMAVFADAAPLEQVEARIKAVLDTLKSEAGAAAAAFLKTSDRA